MRAILIGARAVLASPVVLAAAGTLALTLALQELGKQAQEVTEAAAAAQEQTAQLNGQAPSSPVDRDLPDRRVPVVNTDEMERP